VTVLLIDLRRCGAQLTGTLRRPTDPTGVDFWGVLELLVAIERLIAEDTAEQRSGTSTE